jgi:hypothetical protein
MGRNVVRAHPCGRVGITTGTLADQRMHKTARALALDMPFTANIGEARGNPLSRK